jgi:hypothetical protein
VLQYIIYGGIEMRLDMGAIQKQRNMLGRISWEFEQEFWGKGSLRGLLKMKLFVTIGISDWKF